MNIIAFDLGKNFAWATNCHGLITGHIILAGPRAHRQGALHLFLAAHLCLMPYEAVVYETPFARGRDATRSLWGIAGLIEASATNANLPVVDVAVSTIKKFACGDGQAPKSDMIGAAKRMGYRGFNEHEADAVCLLKYAEANLEHV